MGVILLPPVDSGISVEKGRRYNAAVARTRPSRTAAGVEAQPDAASTVVVSLLKQRATATKGRVHDRRRAKILRAAHRLYTVEGYPSVSMREVAKKVGFSAQAIYYYFPSKEAMFAALADEGLRLLEAQHPSEELPDTLDNLRLPYVRYYEFSKSHPEYFTLLWVDPTAATTQGEPQLALIGRMVRDVRLRLERCVREGLMPADIDYDLAQSVLFGAVHGPAVMGLTGRPGDGDYDLVARTALDAVIAGLRTGVARRTSTSGSTPPMGWSPAGR